MDEFYMRKALVQASKAYKLNEVPIGAIIILDNKIIARAYNKKESTNNCIMHAEIIAITKTCRKLKTWRLDNCILYVTLEPCTMCLGAISEARIKKIVYGAYRDDINGNINNRYVDVESNGGVLEDECSNIIKKFFKDKRKQM